MVSRQHVTEFAALGGVVVVTFGLSLATLTTGPGFGLMAVVGFVFAVRATDTYLLRRRRAGRAAQRAGRDRSGADAVTTELWQGVATAFAAIDNAVTPEQAVVATTWMTSDYAARWRTNWSEWRAARVFGLRPSTTIVGWTVLTLSGSGDVAYVRLFLADASSPVAPWVEHWNFRRTVMEPQMPCAACGVRASATPGRCPACGATMRVARARWLVDGIGAPSTAGPAAVRMLAGAARLGGPAVATAPVVPV